MRESNSHQRFWRPLSYHLTNPLSTRGALRRQATLMCDTFIKLPHIISRCQGLKPVYVRTNDHIDAHFASCFLALVLERLLEHKLDHKYPTGQIIDSVSKYNCTHLDTNNWQFTYYDEVIDACGKALDMNLKKKYRTQQEVQRLLRY